MSQNLSIILTTNKLFVTVASLKYFWLTERSQNWSTNNVVQIKLGKQFLPFC
jgi:hypothetical protein